MFLERHFFNRMGKYTTEVGTCPCGAPVVTEPWKNGGRWATKCRVFGCQETAFEAGEPLTLEICKEIGTPPAKWPGGGTGMHVDGTSPPKPPLDKSQIFELIATMNMTNEKIDLLTARFDALEERLIGPLPPAPKRQKKTHITIPSQEEVDAQLNL